MRGGGDEPLETDLERTPGVADHGAIGEQLDIDVVDSARDCRGQRGAGIRLTPMAGLRIDRKIRRIVVPPLAAVHVVTISAIPISSEWPRTDLASRRVRVADRMAKLVQKFRKADRRRIFQIGTDDLNPDGKVSRRSDRAHG